MKSQFIADTDNNRLNGVEISLDQYPGYDAKELLITKASVSRAQRRQCHSMNPFNRHAVTKATRHDGLNHLSRRLIPTIAWNGVKNSPIWHPYEHMLKNLATLRKPPASDMKAFMKVSLKMLSVTTHQTGSDSSRTIQRHIGRVDQGVRWLLDDVTVLDGSYSFHPPRNKPLIVASATTRSSSGG